MQKKLTRFCLEGPKKVHRGVRKIGGEKEARQVVYYVFKLISQLIKKKNQKTNCSVLQTSRRAQVLSCQIL